MIRRYVLVLLILSALFTVSAEEMDMVVLLDVSESMFPYFDDTVNFLLKDIVDEHLEYGDGFHLLSFAGAPEREINRVIKERGDIEAVLARIMLLHPLGKHTDLLFALNYLFEYVKGLPLSTAKNILILTDGIHDPPPGSPYPAGTEAEREANREEAVRISTALKRQGWKVRLIEFPRGTDGLEDQTVENNNLFLPMAETLGVEVIKYENGEDISHSATGAPSLQFPGDLGRVGSEFTVPFRVQNFLNEPLIVKLDQVLSRNVNLLKEPVRLRVGGGSSADLNARLSLPESFEAGEYLIDVELVFSDNLRIYPRSGELSFELRDSGFGWLKLPLIILIIVIASLLLIFFTIVPLRRHIELNAGKEVYNAPRRGVGEEREAHGYAPGQGSDEKQQQGSAAKVPLDQIETRRAGTETALPAGRTPDGKVPLMEVSQRSGGGKIPLSQISSSRHSGVYPLSSDPSKLGHRPVEFRLSGQNPYNGGRNIRWIGNSTRSVGGGGSFFLIFLVKVPERIAEVTFTEKGLRFTPLKAEFFPDLQGPVENCINRPVPLRTDHGDFSLLFREWISPLERINRILHLIDEPGLKSYSPDEE